MRCYRFKLPLVKLCLFREFLMKVTYLVKSQQPLLVKLADHSQECLIVFQTQLESLQLIPFELHQSCLTLLGIQRNLLTFSRLLKRKLSSVVWLVTYLLLKLEVVFSNLPRHVNSWALLNRKRGFNSSKRHLKAKHWIELWKLWTHHAWYRRSPWFSELSLALSVWCTLQLEGLRNQESCLSWWDVLLSQTSMQYLTQEGYTLNPMMKN